MYKEIKEINDPELLEFIRKVKSHGCGSSVGARKEGEDLTIDGHINKYGGIESHADGKVYTTKRDYLDHLKANDCHIKDY